MPITFDYRQLAFTRYARRNTGHQRSPVLKSTIANEIKLKNRIKDASSNKFKMIPIPVERPKMSITSVLKPEISGISVNKSVSVLSKLMYEIPFCEMKCYCFPVVISIEI